jgi:4-amino-4-deoxy-L-arabinose transferase-like glycosyltransferase
MPKRIRNAPPSSPWDSEVRLLAWLATCVSVISFLFYFQRGDVSLYGDAVAHMNIARRVFDSKTPGLLQLGTVWLPLPHLLMIPFLISGEMWRRGVGGSIPSLVAYVLGAIGMFRLIRGALSRDLEPDAPARIAAWTAALVYAANPNLIYIQTTAMGEALYLAFFVWALVYLAEAARGDAKSPTKSLTKSLTKCGCCLAAACLTRYDGWFLSAAIATVVVLLRSFSGSSLSRKTFTVRIPPAAVVKFVLIAAAAPLLWLAYNAIVYRNPLEFANGPYSAKAIERKTQSAGNPGHPGSGNPLLAEMYFVKSAEANMAQNEWLQRIWVLLAVAATVAAALIYRRNPTEVASSPPGAWPLLFLLIPLPFYSLSVAYGGVPIFIPAWWPFTHYNVRYGLQLLPAFATALGILVHRVIRSEQWNPRLRFACVLSLFAFVIASYTSIWRAVPVSLKEAQVNMRTRHQLETQLASWLQKLPPDSTLLMYLGDHVGAVQQAGTPLKRVINEGNHRTWRQPADPDGLWEHALADPPRYADYVVAFEGDSVWQAVQGRHLPELVEIHVTGQARAVLFRAR